MPLKTQAELLKKYKGKDTNLNLDRALRRAAGFGPAKDVLELIKLGASPKSQGSDGRTALHWAAINKKMENVAILQKNNASLYSEDNHKKTPAQILQINQDTPLFTFDLFVQWAQYLSFTELQNLKLVSWVANQAVKAQNDHILNIITSEQKDALLKLPPIIQFYLKEQLHHNGLNKQVEIALTTLTLEINERKEFLQKSLDVDFSKNATQPLNDTVVILICFNILSMQQLAMLHLRLTEINAYIIPLLTEKLINIDVNTATNTFGSYTTYQSCTNFNSLCTANGLKALRLKILTQKEAAYLQDIKNILSDAGLKFIADGHISIKLIVEICKKINDFEMQQLIEPEADEVFKKGIVTFKNYDPNNTDDIQEATKLYQVFYIFKNPLIKNVIQEKLATAQQLLKLKHPYVSFNALYLLLKEGHIIADELDKISEPDVLISQLSLLAFQEGVITWKQAIEIKNIKYFIHEKCIAALKNGIIAIPTIQQLAETPIGASNIPIILSDNGLAAIDQGIITLEDAKKYSLAILNIPNGLYALKEGLITLEQASKFHGYGGMLRPRSLFILLTDVGLQALKEKLITPEEASEFYHSGSCDGPSDSLDILLNQVGIIALRKKLIKPSEATLITELGALFQENNPDIIKALELKLISPNDFKYGKKYSFWGRPSDAPHDIISITKKLLENYAKSIKSHDNSDDHATLIQKHWRSHISRCQLTLFKQLNNIIKSPTIHLNKMDKASQTKELIEQGKIQEARISMKRI